MEPIDDLTLEQAMQSVAPPEEWDFLNAILVSPGETAPVEEIIQDFCRQYKEPDLQELLKQAPFHVFWVLNQDLERCRLVIVDKRPLAATYAALQSLKGGLF